MTVSRGKRWSPGGWRRARRALGVAAAAGLVWAGGGGCTSKQENRWYFAAAEVPAVRVEEDKDKKKVTLHVDPVKLKFYRVHVNGWSLNGEAELLSGLYPAEPLHELFGEVKRPKDQASTQPSAGQATAAQQAPLTFQCDPSTGRMSVIPPGSRFTVFYGMNATAMADQVKQFAEADETGDLMARLMLAASGAGELVAATNAAEAEATTLATAVGTGAPAAIGTAIKAIDDAAAGDAKDVATRKALAKLAQSLLTSLGSSSTLDETKNEWSDKAKQDLAAIRGDKKDGAK